MAIICVCDSVCQRDKTKRLKTCDINPWFRTPLTRGSEPGGYVASLVILVISSLVFITLTDRITDADDRHTHSHDYQSDVSHVGHF